MKKKKVLAILLTLSMSFSLLAGCGSSGNTGDTQGASETAPVAEGTDPGTAEVTNADTGAKDADGNGRYDYIAFATNADPGDLSPWNTTANSKAPITFAIYDSLFDYIGGEYVPNVAKGYTEIDDLHWEVEIYDYVADWNGNNITADDIVFDYEQYVNSGFATRFTLFEKVEAVDDYTLQFTWTAPVVEVGALDRIFCYVPVYSKAEFEANNFATSPVATGPYKLVSYTADSKVVVEVNEDYWQTDESLLSPMRQRNVDTIEYIVVNETAQNVIGLQSGMLDVSQYVPTEDIARFEDGGESADIYDVRSVPVGEGYFITANCSDSSAFADENLRKAVYYAIDNEAIVTAVGGGMHACKAFASPIYADYVEAWENEETYFNTCDLELAKEYLAKSSYNGEKLVLLGCNDATYETILTVIQGCLLQLGVNVEIQALETAQVQSLSADKNSWDLYVVKYGGPSVIGAANKLVNWNEYNGEYALGFITDPDLQALYETAVTEATWNDDTMTDLFNHIVEHAYDYTLVYNDFNVVYNSDVNDIYVWDAYLLPHCFIYNLD